MDGLIELVLDFIFDVIVGAERKNKERLDRAESGTKAITYLIAAIIFALILSGMFIFIYLSLITVGIAIKIIYSIIVIILGAILINFVKMFLARRK